MAHSGPNGGRHNEDGFHPSRVSGAGRRVGWALLGAAIPAVLATVAVAIVQGSIGAGLLQWVETSFDTRLVAGTGLKWAFHVGALTGLFGLWALGLSLVVEGYFGVE